MGILTHEARQAVRLARAAKVAAEQAALSYQRCSGCGCDADPDSLAYTEGCGACWSRRRNRDRYANDTEWKSRENARKRARRLCGSRGPSRSGARPDKRTAAGAGGGHHAAAGTRSRDLVPA